MLRATAGRCCRFGSATPCSATRCSTARASRSSTACCARPRDRRRRPLRRNPHAVPFKRSRRGKLTELMAHHVFRDVHGNKLLSIMDGNSVTHHFRENRGTPRPSLHYLLLETSIQELDFLQQVAVDERAFFKRPCQLILPFTSSRAVSQSTFQSACCGASCSLASAGPTGSPDAVHPRFCLPRRRADGPQDSSPRRGWWAGCPSSACGPLCLS